MDESPIGSILPHADFGDPECCGCLNAIAYGDEFDLTCNECGAIVRTVPAEDLTATLNEMELQLGMCTQMCPHCRTVNIFPGFDRIEAFVC